MMKLTLDHEQIDQAIREYVQSQGFSMPIDPTVIVGMVKLNEKYVTTATVEIVGVK